MGASDAALVVAACLWCLALAPAGTPGSACADGADNAARCAELAGSEPELLLFGGRLDLNRAQARNLEVLPGIGPARAAAIVAERCRRPFASLGDVERVAGIGPALRGGMAERAVVTPGGEADCGAGRTGSGSRDQRAFPMN